ncbi:MAG: hypothetical protein ACR2KU_04950 [Gammaproteobacteria bacterium]
MAHLRGRQAILGAARSALISIDYSDGAMRLETFRYYTEPMIKAATKYEDFAFTPDGKYVIAAPHHSSKRSQQFHN